VRKELKVKHDTATSHEGVVYRGRCGEGNKAGGMTVACGALSACFCAPCGGTGSVALHCKSPRTIFVTVIIVAAPSRTPEFNDQEY